MLPYSKGTGEISAKSDGTKLLGVSVEEQERGMCEHVKQQHAKL